MFDIGFSELLLVFVIGLIVLGPQRLPVAVKTVVGWIRTLRSLATTVQNELAQELKLQEFQESLKKVEKASLNNLTPELKASMDELREAAESMKRSYSAHDPEKPATKPIPSLIRWSKAAKRSARTSRRRRQNIRPALRLMRQIPLPPSNLLHRLTFRQRKRPLRRQFPILPPHRVINRKHGRRRYTTANFASD